MVKTKELPQKLRQKLISLQQKGNGYKNISDLEHSWNCGSIVVQHMKQEQTYLAAENSPKSLSNLIK